MGIHRRHSDEEERKGRFLALTLGRDVSTKRPTVSGRAMGAFLPEGTSSILHRNEWIFASFKNSPVAEANVMAAVSGHNVTLTTDRPAFFVWLDVPGIRGEFDDNSFTLLPGESRTVTFVSTESIPATLPEVTVSILR